MRTPFRLASLVRLAPLVLCTSSAAQLPGDVLAWTETTQGFAAGVPFDPYVGAGLAALGDLDGDGTGDVAVGSPEWTGTTGSVYVFLMNADGTRKASVRIADGVGGLPAGLLDANDRFGSSVAALGDLDGDGTTELAVGAIGDDDGSTWVGEFPGAVWILFLNTDGTVKAHAKLSETAGGFGFDIYHAWFGAAVAGLGDVDGDGVPDLAAGAWNYVSGVLGANKGAVFVVLLNADGSAKATQRISDVELGGVFFGDPDFGAALEFLGDLDGDGAPELAIGEPDAYIGFAKRGGLWIVSLNNDGTLKTALEIQPTVDLFQPAVDRRFGCSLAAVGDLDEDGTGDLVVGECDDFPMARAWVLFLRPDGTVREARLLQGAPGVTLPAYTGSADFAAALEPLGDLDGDGSPDLAVGAPGFASDDGAFWTFFQFAAKLVEPYGCGVNPQKSLVHLGGKVVPGAVVTLGVDNPAGTQAPGALPFVALSGQPDQGFPCGTVLPGFGMSAAGAGGELLIWMLGGNPFAIHIGGPWQGAGTPAPVAILIPDLPTLVGSSIYAQGLLFEPVPTAGVQFGLAGALELRVQP